MEKVKRIIRLLLRRSRVVRARLSQEFRVRPLRSFSVLFTLTLLLIIAANFISSNSVKETKSTPAAKAVPVYAIGSVPFVNLEGQIDKSGVVTITSLSPGVVQNIFVTEGQAVDRGSWIAELSTSYDGGNLPGLQRQLAEVQYNNLLNNFDTQKDLLLKQRDLANASADNAEKLRGIVNQSVSETQNLVNLNGDIIKNLSANLDNFTATNSGGTNDALILATREMLSQFTAGQNQVQSALRGAQYQGDAGGPAGRIPGLQKDIALRQLDLQEKTLEVGREISRLTLAIAKVAESMMMPTAPYGGVIQKVFVRVGQAVSPGTPLAVISADTAKTVKVTVFTSAEIAGRVSLTQDSLIHLGNRKIALKPLFVSREAVTGTLYALTYVLPEDAGTLATDKSYVTVEVPVGYAQTLSADPFIPIDAVYQTSESSYVYLLTNGQAVSRAVHLGSIFGSFVEVTGGLTDTDQVILDRTVIFGDKVVPAKTQ